MTFQTAMKHNFSRNQDEADESIPTLDFSKSMKISSPADLIDDAPELKSSTGCLPGPPSIKYIIINEACERFGYYALRSILFMYLSDRLGYAENVALAICSGTIAIAYFTPLLGGYISDSFWGKYKTIIVFSALYVVSAATLSYSAVNFDKSVAIIGLVGISVATGGIKPCVSAFGADQFNDQSRKSLDTYFAIFYMSINIASLISFLLIPIVRSKVSYLAAFALPSAMLFISILIFVIPSRQYTYIQPSGSILARLWPAIVYVFWSNSSSPNRIAEAEVRFGREEARMVEALTKVLPVFFFLPMFWCVYDLQSGAWQAQAKSMNLDGLQLEQIGALNTVFVLILVPLLDQYIYPTLKRYGFQTGHMSRIYVGLVTVVFAMGLVAMLQYYIDLAPPKSVHIWFQVPQYALMSLAEALISVTALTFAYENAPVELKTVISSFNLCTSAIGNMISTLIFSTCQLQGEISLLQQFLIFTTLITINAVGFHCYISKRDNSKKVVEESDRETRELLDGTL